MKSLGSLSAGPVLVCIAKRGLCAGRVLMEGSGVCVDGKAVQESEGKWTSVGIINTVV